MRTQRACSNALAVATRYAKVKLNELIVQELEASPPSEGEDD